jgi:hypothetical protein
MRPASVVGAQSSAPSGADPKYLPVSTPQRLLLVLSLLVAGGAVAGALLMGGKEGTGGPPRIEPIAGSGADRAPTPRPNLEGPSQPNRLSAEGEPAGRLEVRVLNQDGGSVPAEVRLFGAEDQEFTVVGSTTWQEFPVGEWELRARIEGLIAYRESFTVTDGETTRVTAQLLTAIPVRGKIVDRFGQGVGPTNVWFIRREQAYPVSSTESRKIQSCTSDSRGVFKTEIDKKGFIRVAVGKPGRKLVESEPIYFSSSGPHEFTVVIEGTASLEIELEDPPLALAEGKANLVITVLAERGERGEGPRKGRGNAERKGKGKDAEAGEARELRGSRDSGAKKNGEAGLSARDEEASSELGYTGEGTADGTAVEKPQVDHGAPSEPRWATLAERRIPPEGQVSFEAMPPDRELVIQLTRRSDQFRSQPIRLSSNHASVVRIRVPGKRPDDERAAQQFGDMTALVRQRPLPSDAPEVGITWK